MGRQNIPDSPTIHLGISQSDRNTCQHPDCQTNIPSANTPSKCFKHMIIHGPRRFQCSKCNYKTCRGSTIAGHLKRKCRGKCVDKLDQGMIEEWRELSVICYPDRAKEIGALITKKESKLLPSSNLQIDQSAKCQFPNCRSEAQHVQQTRCFQHLITHGPRRFTCSNCDYTGHHLQNIKTHFLRKTGCQGEIIDHIDQTMVEEWTELAKICFPLHVRGLSYLIRKELAKSQKVSKTNVSSRTIEIAMVDIENTERNGFTQIEETQNAPLMSIPSRSRSNYPTASGDAFIQTDDARSWSLPLSSVVEDESSLRTQEATLIPIPPLSQSMNDVWEVELNFPTTSGDAAIQADDVRSSSLSLMSLVVKDESPPRTQSIHQQDRDLQLQQLTQEVVGLRAENQILTTRVAEETNAKDVAHKLLGEKNTENEMQKKKIRQLQRELDKYVVTLD